MYKYIVHLLCLFSVVILLSCILPAVSVQSSSEKTTDSIVYDRTYNHSFTLKEGEINISSLFYDYPILFIRSSNPSVASVNANGIITARQPGTAEILCNSPKYCTLFYVHVVSSDYTGTTEYPSGNISVKDAFNIEEKLLFMEKDDSFSCQLTDASGSSLSGLIGYTWKSSDIHVAQVSNTGVITAKNKGSAVITCSNGSTSIPVYVNVVTRDYNSKDCDFSMLSADGETRTYRMFKQNSYDYPKYNKYIGWHGCATCSLATVLGAYNPNYKDILPSSVIDGPEKQTVSSKAWNREHKERSLPKQMPLSLFGIASILNKYNVPADYVRTYKEKEAAEDITRHLKSGNPVIFEVGKKNNRTGKKSKRWTSSYHTMILLGILTNGNVMVCDSIDRGWKNNGERIKIVPLEDVMAYMFPCTEFSESMYYNGAASDGGYIKCGKVSAASDK